VSPTHRTFSETVITVARIQFLRSAWQRDLMTFVLLNRDELAKETYMKIVDRPSIYNFFSMPIL